MAQKFSRGSLLNQASLLSDESFEERMKYLRKELLNKFLNKHGFASVDRPREGPKGGRVWMEPLYAIHLAAWNADSLALKLLLAEGADPDATFKGSNALEIAMEEDQDGSHSEVIGILKNALQIRTLQL
eukprot:Skav211784  [mRNA]  locus=scaffold305:159311:159697:+ [translate_table: standard]